MPPPKDNDDTSPALAQLSLENKKDAPKQKAPKKKKAKKVVADSWEDEDSESEPEPEKAEEEEISAPEQSTTSAAVSSSSDPSFDSPWSLANDSSSSRTVDPGKRPEKTDAVARRMIAAGLGLRAPKQTEEQKAYQKSIREQEKRKKEQERELEQKRREEAEKAKAAMWDD